MHEYQQGEFTISTDPARLDVDVILGFTPFKNPERWLEKFDPHANVQT